MHWGFKDVGLPPSKMKTVYDAMRAAGKTTFLEVVSLSEKEGLDGARTRRRAGRRLPHGNGLLRLDQRVRQGERSQIPAFCRTRSQSPQHPRRRDRRDRGRRATARGKGCCRPRSADLSARRRCGEAVEGSGQGVAFPVVSAGSIESYRRIAEVWDAGAWGFTMGTALFDRAFVPDGTLSDNILAVCDWLDHASEANLHKYIREGQR